MVNYGNKNGGSASTRKKLSSSEYNTVYRRKPSPSNRNKWIEHNKKEYGVQCGTPLFINEEIFPGYVSDQQIKSLLK